MEETTAIDELIKGRDSTIRLELFLQEVLPPEARGPDSKFGGLIREILGSFDRALTNLDPEGRRSGPLLDRRSEDFSVRRTIRSGRRSGYRRRAHPYSCTQVKKKTMDDGYTWRKYGQKVIFSAKHPRSYFRCSYKYDKGCQATRQVQRSEEDPTMFEITYMGEHTCRDVPDSSIIINFDPTATNNNNNNDQHVPPFTCSQSQEEEHFEEEVISNLITGSSSSENLVLQDFAAFDGSAMPKMEVEITSDLQSPCGSCVLEFDDQGTFSIDDILSFEHYRFFRDQSCLY